MLHVGTLQPLMVCFSHKKMIALVNQSSEDHDFLFWAEGLKKFVEVQKCSSDSFD